MILDASVIQFHSVAVVGIVGLAALALGCWFNAWAKCITCAKQRAYCECADSKGDNVRKPKWSDPRTGKKWDDEE